MKDKDLTSSLKDDGEWATFMVCWNVYVASKNGDPVEEVEGYVAPASRSGPLTTIVEEESTGLVERIPVSHFWPLDCLDEVTDKPPQPHEIVKDTGAFGDACDGVYRLPKDDPKRNDLPKRVKVIEKEQRRGATKSKVKDDSREHVREGQGRDAWANTKRKLDDIRLESTDVDGTNMALRLLRPHRSDSSDDFATFPTITPKKKKTPGRSRLEARPCRLLGLLALPTEGPQMRVCRRRPTPS